MRGLRATLVPACACGLFRRSLAYRTRSWCLIPEFRAARIRNRSSDCDNGSFDPIASCLTAGTETIT
ncbi:hypothetical protein [Burkholderia phage BgVeeders33]|nr:hypothetical protein [Burkholderia phage BgVeeders33]